VSGAELILALLATAWLAFRFGRASMKREMRDDFLSLVRRDPEGFRESVEAIEAAARVEAQRQAAPWN
jgi:hypothetical protein